MLPDILSFFDHGRATSIVLIIVLLVLFFLSSFLNRRMRRSIAKPNYNNLRRRPILSDHEQAFYQCLIDALPQYHIFVQVSLDALLKTSQGLSRSARQSLRNTFSQKHPDFVLCQKDSLEVVAIVELDDKTHEARRDADRDAMLDAVQYRVMRFTDKDKPWHEAIVKRLGSPF